MAFEGSGGGRRPLVGVERVDRARFVVFHIEYGVQLSELQETVKRLGGVNQLKCL